MAQIQSINKFGVSIFADDISNALDNEDEDAGYISVDMKGEIISNVGDPISPQDVATKNYVDGTHVTFFRRSAGPDQALTGDLYLGEHKIKDVSTPTEDNDVVNVNYFRSQTSDFCSKTGFTMTTGDIKLNNKLLMLKDDSSTSIKSDESDNVFFNFKRFLTFNRLGNTRLILGPQISFYTDVNCNNKVIFNVRAPTADDHAVNRGYLTSTYCTKTGFSMNGEINMGGNSLRFSTAHISQINQTLYIDCDQISLARGGGNIINTSNDGLLLYKPFNINNQTIYGVPNPINPNHAVNKAYVDGKYGTIIPLYSSLRVDKFGHPRFWPHVNLKIGLLTTEFDNLPTGMFGCDSLTLPEDRKGSLPSERGFIIVVGYRLEGINIKNIKWISAITGDEWSSRLLNNVWTTWRKHNTYSLESNMQKDLDMSGYKIINLGNPTINTDGTNKSYVDNADNLKLNKAGDIMTGNLIMSGYFINNIHEPVLSGDATTKNYVDTNTSLKVNKAGDTMSGNLNMNGNNVIGLPILLSGISGNTSALSYGLFLNLLADFDSTVVKRTGSTMTGNLNMGGNIVTNVTAPTVNSDVTNKNYVDTADNLKVNKSGDTMTGNLLFSTAVNNISVGCTDLTAGKEFAIELGSIDDAIICTYQQPIKIDTVNGTHIYCNEGQVARFGMSPTDTRSSFFTDVLMNQNYIANLHDPNSPQDAATKNYVDNTKVSKSGDTMTGNLNMNDNFIANLHEPNSIQDATTKNYVDTRDNLKVSKSGDTMTGNLNMSNNYITNLRDPLLIQDSATKNYVDTRLIKSSTPVIPFLSGLTNNKGGYIVTQSSQVNNNYTAWRIWNYAASSIAGGGGEWATGAAPSISVPQYFTIQFPVAVRIWKFEIIGRIGQTQYFTDWSIQVSNDGITYSTLFTSVDTLDNTFKSYLVDSVSSYLYYKFNAVASIGGNNVGISYFQMYSFNTISQ